MMHTDLAFAGAYRDMGNSWIVCELLADKELGGTLEADGFYGIGLYRGVGYPPGVRDG
jgi:hypothetical protein